MDKNNVGRCSVQPQDLSLRENPFNSESSSPNSVAEKQNVVRQNQNQNQTSSNSMNSAGAAEDRGNHQERKGREGRDRWTSL